MKIENTAAEDVRLMQQSIKVLTWNLAMLTLVND
jgi:hypothetical protein